MRETLRDVEWYKLIGFVVREDSTPHFVDLVFEEVLLSWKSREARRFIQRTNEMDIVISFVEIDDYQHDILDFPTSISSRSLRVGDVSLYGVRLTGEFDFDRFPVIAGFSAACEEVLSNTNIRFTYANPFFGLAVAQAINATEREIEFASLCFRILQATSVTFAKNWIVDRPLSEIARNAIEGLIGSAMMNSDQIETSNSINHVRVAILENVPHKEISNRYFWEGDKLISFRISGVDLMFEGRTTNFDAVVAHLPSFYNGEDFSDICKIAITPDTPSRSLLGSQLAQDYAAILSKNSPELAEVIKATVITSFAKN